MTNPSDELHAAAATLRKLTSDATPGPWRRPLNTRYKSTVTGPLPEGERGTWLDGNDPDTGEREQCTVAMIPTWSNGRHSRQRGGRDLEYIAAMGPSVGAALADWLDATATSLAASTHPDWQEIVAQHPLAVARAINGGQP